MNSEIVWRLERSFEGVVGPAVTGGNPELRLDTGPLTTNRDAVEEREVLERRGAGMSAKAAEIRDLLQGAAARSGHELTKIIGDPEVIERLSEGKRAGEPWVDPLGELGEAEAAHEEMLEEHNRELERAYEYPELRPTFVAKWEHDPWAPPPPLDLTPDPALEGMTVRIPLIPPGKGRPAEVVKKKRARKATCEHRVPAESYCRVCDN